MKIQSPAAGGMQMRRYEQRYHSITNEINRAWTKYPKAKREQYLRKVEHKQLNPLIQKVVAHREYLGHKLRVKADEKVTRQALKGEQGHIQMLKPKEFLQKASFGVSLPKMFKLYKGYKNGRPYTITTLQVKGNKVIGHQGRHRAYVATMFGVKKIPVAIVGREQSYFNVKKARPQDHTPKSALQKSVLKIVSKI